MSKPPQVFLAHASEDKDAVRQLHAQLTSCGFKPWLDEVDLIPGQNWQAEISRAIKNSDVFAACLSAKSVRKEGYVQKEFRIALDEYAKRPLGSIYFIPVKLDDCEIPDLQIPRLGIALRDFQWVEVWKPGGFERLASAIEHAQTSSHSAQNVVILVHGIRDFALWQERVSTALRINGFQVHPTNYGRFDFFRFLIPMPYFRKRVAEKILRQIRIVRQHNEDSHISIIAHSFGTYVVSNILKESFDLRVKRVIFCGSVVKYDFPFEQFHHRFDAPILNEVGARDIWPAMAESITWGYGSAGTYGFRRPLVRDRWHNKAGHGYFLNESFCIKYWVPFLETGKIVSTNPVPESPPLWIRVLSVFRMKYIVPSIFILSLYTLLEPGLLLFNQYLFAPPLTWTESPSSNREAAIVSRFLCPGGTARQYWIYQYTARPPGAPTFSVILPPNWGQPVGGYDVATRKDAERIARDACNSSQQISIKNGMIVAPQRQGGTTYIIENETKCAILDFETFENLGLKWEELIRLSDDQLNAIPTGDPMPRKTSPSLQIRPPSQTR